MRVYIIGNYVHRYALPRKTESPPMISGSLRTRERARRKPRNDVAGLGEADVVRHFPLEVREPLTL
jgi:hypothetical protein